MIWPMLIPPVALGAAIGAYNYLEGESLIRDVWYELSLSRTSILTLDARWCSHPHRSDAIVSMTTIPSRLGFIGETLKSLLLQSRVPRKIRLNLPSFSKRERTAYAIPDWLKQLRSVELVACEDFGPATKLIPSLIALEPTQRIVIVDDDRIYPPDLIAELEAAAALKVRSALGFGGWIAPCDLVDRPTTLYTNLFQKPPAPVRGVRIRTPIEVDVLQGMAGYLVRPEFFDLARVMDYGQAPPAAFFADDVWLSAHCAVPKFVVPSRRSNFPPKRRAAFYKRSSLGRINRGGGGNESRYNTIMLKHFASVWKVGGDARERRAALR